MKESTPKGMRLHIGLFGRRNVGKSSLLNAVVRQQVSIVSEFAGTTTDPVDKPMELLPIGPVLFIDTAGIDDEGALGQLRIGKTRKAIERTDIGVIVTDGEWDSFEEHLRAELTARGVPTIAALNKADLHQPPAELIDRLTAQNLRVVPVSSTTGQGLDDFRAALLAAAPAEFIDSPAIISDLVGPGQTAVLVIPIDKEAPKGRIILPQVQTIRDLLDHNAMCVVTQVGQLPAALANLKQPPSLVVTDSQAFKEVAAVVPPDVQLTGFSVLYSRFKGDLLTQTLGAMAVETLRPRDNILVAESCTHHPIEDDIGRVKIPKWLTDYVGGPLNFTTVQGQDFPDDLAPYKLVIHCGACMWNRRLMLNRILKCRQARIPVTNYGLVIAYALGIFQRALEPFPAALHAWHNANNKK